MSNEDKVGSPASPCGPDACHEHSDVHSDCDFPDADLVLSSCDGQLFRVHSCVMRLASRVFNDMLDMPLPAGQTKISDTQDVVPLQERGEVVKLLLDLTYPDRTFSEPQELPFPVFQDLCVAVDKYDMPSAQRTLQMTLHLGVDCYPLIAGYVLASQFGWERERKLFSNRTLGIDLRSQQSREQLRAAAGPATWDLLAFHERRKDILFRALDATLWARSGSDHCIGWEKAGAHACRQTHGLLTRMHMHLPGWTALIYRISEKMEHCSLGTSLRDDAFWDQEEFKEIWEIKCCNRNLICKANLRQEVLRVIDNLPKTVKQSNPASGL